MGKIFLTSDLHFFHNKEFIYKARGFESVDEMNAGIIKNWNEIIDDEDDVYVLGDIALGGGSQQVLLDTLWLLGELKGKLHLVRGNHDTDNRWKAYATLPNVVEQQNAIYLKYRGYHFYLSHFPTITANLEKESLRQCTINLYGHTHQKTNFYEEIPFIYHVGLDSHDCKPVLIEDVMRDMFAKVEECKKELEDAITVAAGFTPGFDDFQNRCEKCVWYHSDCPGANLATGRSCPDGYKYRRDPPDGGYYG